MYFRYFTQALNIAGTILILLMAISVNLDVLGRNAFNQPIPGVNEFIGLSIVAVVFLQMANTLQEDRHVSNDIIIRLIADTHPRLSAALYSSFHVIGALLMAIIVIYVWPLFRRELPGRLLPGHRRHRRDQDLAVHGGGRDRLHHDRDPVSDRCVAPGAAGRSVRA